MFPRAGKNQTKKQHHEGKRRAHPLYEIVWRSRLPRRAKFCPAGEKFENQGLFLEGILKGKCLAAGIAGAENRVSGAPLFRDPPAGNRREMGVNRVLVRKILGSQITRDRHG